MCMYSTVDDCVTFLIIFFKQKTAYELRISDWSSVVFSSDLPAQLLGRGIVAPPHQLGVVLLLVRLDRGCQCLHLGDVGEQRPARRLDRAGVVDQGPEDRKSVVKGTSVSVRVDLAGRRIIQTKQQRIISQPVRIHTPIK